VRSACERLPQRYSRTTPSVDRLTDLSGPGPVRTIELQNRADVEKRAMSYQALFFRESK